MKLEEIEEELTAAAQEQDDSEEQPPGGARHNFTMIDPVTGLLARKYWDCDGHLGSVGE